MKKLKIQSEINENQSFSIKTFSIKLFKKKYFEKFISETQI